MVEGNYYESYLTKINIFEIPEKSSNFYISIDYLYFKNDVGKSNKGNLSLGPFESKKICAIEVIEKLANNKVRLLKDSIDNLLDSTGCNLSDLNEKDLFKNYEDSIEEYYRTGVKKNG